MTFILNFIPAFVCALFLGATLGEYLSNKLYDHLRPNSLDLRDNQGS